MHVLCLVTQLCPTLCDPMDCSPPCSSVHGIFQARIVERVAISYSSGSSRPRNRTWVSYISCNGRQILYYYATWEAQDMYMHICACVCVFHIYVCVRMCVCVYIYIYIYISNLDPALPSHNHRYLAKLPWSPTWGDQSLLYYFYCWCNIALPCTVASGTSSNHFPIQNSRMAQTHTWHDDPRSAPQLSDHTSDHAPSSLWPHPSWTWSSPPRSVHEEGESSLH